MVNEIKDLKGIMAEFKIQEERKGDKSRTILIIHNEIIAKSKWHDVFTNKTYEKLFDYVKKEVEE